MSKRAGLLLYELFIDERQLEMSRKTIYTAIEIYLIPLQRAECGVIEQFTLPENTWTQHYLPNKRSSRIIYLETFKTRRVQEIISIEILLTETWAGDMIDNWLIKANNCQSRWLKREKKLS